MSTTLSKKTWAEKLFDPIERRYTCLEDVCLGAISNLNRGNALSFAIFAKNIPWWKVPFSRVFRKQILREDSVDGITYQKWKEAYKSLPQKTREQAEAKLPF